MDDVKLKMLDRADKKITELHSYLRLSVQLVVTWYTFFQTFQFASLGWLAKSGPHDATNRYFMLIAALFFISQNISSYFTCLAVQKEVMETKRKLDSYEEYVAGLNVGGEISAPGDQCLPLNFYNAGLKLMRFSFIPSLAVWILFLISFL